MKKIKTSYLYFICLSDAAAPDFTPGSPGPICRREVPAHYGFSGQVDRWGEASTKR